MRSIGLKSILHGLCIALGLLLAVPAQATGWLITIDTAQIAGSTVDMAFDLLDGGEPSNSVTVNGFGAPGGLLTAEASFGDVTGSLLTPGGVVLGDKEFFNEHLATVTLGGSVVFSFYASNLAAADGAFPDSFAFFMLNPLTGQPLFNTSGPGGALFVVDMGVTPDAAPTLYVAAGNEIVLTASQVPEASSAALLLLGLLTVGVVARGRSAARAAGLSMVLCVVGSSAWATDIGDVSGKVSVTRSGLVFNRASNTFDATATLKNTSDVAVSGPISLALSSISPSSVTLANQAGIDSANRPYVKVPGSLEPGAQTSVLLRFSNPRRVTFSVGTTVIGGSPTLVAAPITLPLVGPGPAFEVTWPVPLLESNLRLEIRPFALLPAASSGKPPRLNALAYVGQRLFVLDEWDGKIFEITGGAVSQWFDVRTAVLAATGRQMYPPIPFPRPDSAHIGLRSLAFHPDFATNGKFYTSLLEVRPPSATGHHYLSDPANPLTTTDSVLVEWTATNPGTTMNVASGSYREVFRVGLKQLDHPIKQIMFRPGATVAHADYGLLYIAHGDGSVASSTFGTGMDKDALGKILRIDPLQANGLPYRVPSGNPFVGSATMIPEAYSIGHRNPHHPAFMKDGTLLVAEPGRDNVEEVNVVKAGRNYGWPVREGTYVHLPGGKLVDGIAVLPADDAALGYTYASMQFLHTGTAHQGFSGQSIGGGFAVENGSALSGKYFAVDFVKTGDIFFGELDALKAAHTQGAPSTLTVAPISRAKILFDHDGNPTTPALALDSMWDVAKLGIYYNGNPSSTVIVPPTCNTPNPNTCRADVRYGQGPKGELYLMSKLNRQVYLVTNSVP